jgi:hypothetical protein
VLEDIESGAAQLSRARIAANAASSTAPPRAVLISMASRFMRERRWRSSKPRVRP